MKILKKIYNQNIRFLSLSLTILFCFKAFSIVGHDDRFYVNKTKWADLLNGIIQVNYACTGFVLEGDVILTAAHCFGVDIDYEEDGIIDAYSPITKDSKIDIKKVKQITVRFGDASFDENDKSEKTHFNESSELFPAKDLFLGYNPKEPSSLGEERSNDYALIKLKDPIPKNIKRFKLFNADLLKDYDILKHSYRGNLSTAGFHRDNTKTMHQRMAHIGCKVRDLKQYKKVWLEYSDCDAFGGASGSPVFYILRHKKTKKIELALRSIAIAIGDFQSERKLETRGYLEENENLRYQLGWSPHYHNSVYFRGQRSANLSLVLSNHKEFLTKLKKFKKDPSFFRNKKIKSIYNKYYDEKWILKSIQKKSSKELKEFLHKTYLKLKDKDAETFFYFYLNLSIVFHEKGKISSEKMKLLEDFFSYSKSVYDKVLLDLYTVRPKKFSERKLEELRYKFGMKDPDTYEDTINDKEKAQKLWDMYFPKKKSTWLKDLFFK